MHISGLTMAENCANCAGLRIISDQDFAGLISHNHTAKNSFKTINERIKYWRRTPKNISLCSWCLDSAKWLLNFWRNSRKVKVEWIEQKKARDRKWVEIIQSINEWLDSQGICCLKCSGRLVQC